MSLANDVSTAKTDVSKVESIVTKDVNVVETDVKGFFSKTYSAKVVLVVGVASLVLGFILGKL